MIFLFDIMCIGSLILSFQRCAVLPSTFKLVKMTVYHRDFVCPAGGSGCW